MVYPNSFLGQREATFTTAHPSFEKCVRVAWPRHFLPHLPGTPSAVYLSRSISVAEGAPGSNLLYAAGPVRLQ